jgi:surfeit locus 1 family protein
MAGCALAALTWSLGNWQSGRAEQKAALEAAMRARDALPPMLLADQPVSLADAQYRRVAARGIWMPESSVYLDNRPLGGRVGYQVITPLLLAPQRAVLVDRGWVEKDPAKQGQPPQVAFPAGTVEIVGNALPQVGRFMELGQSGELRLGGVWNNFDLERYRSLSGLDVLPFILRQSSDSADGLRREVPPLASQVEKHRGYAFQWYALALLSAVLTFTFGYRRVFRS